MQKRDVRSRWLLGARGVQATARWAAQRYSKAQWVYAACLWAGTRASPPTTSPPPRPPACTPHPLPTLPQRWWQRPWARGHGQPGVSWRRSQLLLPVLRAFSGSLTRPSKSGGPVRRQARQSPCSGLAATAASSHGSSQWRAAPRGGREGRRSPEQQCAAVILPKQPVAARAAREPGIGGQLWPAMAMATRPRTLPPALGEGGERVGRRGWGSGGRAAGGLTSAGTRPWVV